MKFQERPPFGHRQNDRRDGQQGKQQHVRHYESEPEPDPEVEDVEEADEASIREGEYLRHLAEEHTPISVHLLTGETFQGHIEYYDRRFIRLTRKGAPNLFIFKKDIKYLSEG
jgi:sRNA-binding regulator protein Hfq